MVKEVQEMHREPREQQRDKVKQITVRNGRNITEEWEKLKKQKRLRNKLQHKR